MKLYPCDPRSDQTDKRIYFEFYLIFLSNSDTAEFSKILLALLFRILITSFHAKNDRPRQKKRIS
ncbi:hypothetical protein LEP1GSC193_1121 [Leptospira alstonii serovar Pingchang str. 80-412]|uniref:Uncharacterized protein n=2 Tax=Leptospira alstonii TaxID=28452 RepID=M6D7B2_9LEPT|nr:hypothetical protein LEP1GSC194_2850 [Leptospira alstonii serovar Sichuan str. 79601]EQA82640.1 hypothetical protein LEP1GSC193_1121 [Leptospira alstonii serovar Pingchang str. 80-412]